MAHRYHLTKKSSNIKTGPIAVSTTSKDSCPATCPLKGNGCYAESGPLLLHWNKVSDGSRGFTIDGFIDVLKTLPEGSINMCVTSPPYYGLRDYGTATWSGGDPNCDHVEKIAAHGGERADRDQSGNIFKFRGTCEKCGATSSDNQIGLEQTPEEYIQQLVEVS